MTRATNIVKQTGFTIVELLVVVVVIGILAAIAIVAFTGVTQQAEASSAKTELRNAGTKLELFRTSNSTYPTNLAVADLKLRDSLQYSYVYDTTTYCLQAVPNKVGADSFHITQEGQVKDGGCTATPISCFAFSAGSITDYYDNQSNNAANPACPRNVVIPSEIGGVAVATIGTSAFLSNQLTSVIIPNTVGRVSTSGFMNNQLTSITIPNSMVSFGPRAFQNNQLTSVTIPNSVATIGSLVFETNLSISCNVPTGRTFTGTGCVSFTYY